jgi:hypothetical protein
VEIVTEEKIQIQFTIRDEDGSTFTDAIYLTTEEYGDTSREALEAMKLARFQAWKTRIAEPAVMLLTPEEIAAQVDALAAAQIATQDQLLALATPERALAILTRQREIIDQQAAALAAKG